ncbi:fumble protein [Cardiosporidium cionae]|uniref:Fumble protein n=1 Tax=Cardiosporidium cionae TaxID=476202 RepID=A0ABQ7J7D3_9APIC|nr:fumble protein [Cardiosporidium cionae]|eukprot:KAF8819909.1 fumble protein [Cardiosporidium cionae]
MLKDDSIPLSSSNSYNADLEAIRRNRCGVDVGGTLAKLVYIAPKFVKEKVLYNRDVLNTCSAIIPDTTIDDEEFHPFSPIVRKDSMDHDLRGNLSRLSISEKELVHSGDKLNVTGGGAYKFAECFTKELDVHLRKQDEMASIMRGLQYLLSLSNSIFRYDLEKKMRISVLLSPPLYPFLVVNIGSGVSILKAKGPNEFARVTGTCIGGGTVLGLARLLFGATSFHEVVTLSEKGEDILDLKVGDLLGDVAADHSLSPDTLASSFGKVCLMNPHMNSLQLRQTLRKADIARSLIHMVSYNIGYLAYLVGTTHHVQRIFFAGKYIDNHAFTMECITRGVNFYTTQYPAASKCVSVSSSLPIHSSEVHMPSFPSTDVFSSHDPSPSAHRSSSLLSTHGQQATPLLDGSFLLPPADYSSNSVKQVIEDFYPTKSKKTHSECDGHNPALQRNQFEVLFLRHDGYLGALGSLLATEER